MWKMGDTIVSLSFVCQWLLKVGGALKASLAGIWIIFWVEATVTRLYFILIFKLQSKSSSHECALLCHIYKLCFKLFSLLSYWIAFLKKSYQHKPYFIFEVRWKCLSANISLNISMKKYVNFGSGDSPSTFLFYSPLTFRNEIESIM